MIAPAPPPPIHLDPAAGFRAVSGLVLAVFVASVFSGVTPALLAEGGSRNSSLIAGTTMVARLPTGTSAAAARAALDATASAGASHGLVLHEDPDPKRPLADPARGRSADTRLVASVDIQRFGVTDACPTGGTARLDTGTDEFRLEPAPYTPAHIADLPARLLAVQTDGTAATTDRVRTAIQRSVPGAVPWLGDEADADADRELTQVNRVANVALAVTLTIAGCSLAVAVAAGIIERKRPFALLRLARRPTATRPHNHAISGALRVAHRWVPRRCPAAASATHRTPSASRIRKRGRITRSVVSWIAGSVAPSDVGRSRLGCSGRASVRLSFWFSCRPGRKAPPREVHPSKRFAQSRTLSAPVLQPRCTLLSV